MHLLFVDSVAARSGVARTTIYRRHRSRAELMTAVLDELIQAPLPAPDLSVAEKLRWVLERVGDVLTHGLGRGGVAAVLADSDPEFTLALRTRIADHLRPLTEMMAADIDTGRLAAHVDPDTLVGLLFGAYLAEALRYGTPRAGWAAATSTSSSSPSRDGQDEPWTAASGRWPDRPRAVSHCI